MEPALKDGSVVMVFQWWVRPKVGEVVVYKQGSEWWVKRIRKITQDGLVMEGDNFSDSLDSRKLGAVDQDSVIGKILFKWLNIKLYQVFITILGLHPKILHSTVKNGFYIT